jgi:hypothetical protein
MNRQKIAVVLSIVLVFSLAAAGGTAIARMSPAAGSEAALTAKDVGAKLFPEKVFFRGQLASTQLRNTGGVRFADDFYVVAGLCDNSGYASEVKQKFQGYLLSEVSLEIGGKSLKPGAYAFGFLSGGQFLVMDIGANDLFQVASTKDTEIKRPTPLQVLAASDKGTYRLYAGRDYVEFHRGQ